MQSAVRVVKSGLIASKGQIAVHLPQSMQLVSTLRWVTRSTLASEKTAPVGQRYLHQNRLPKKPRREGAEEQSDREVLPRIHGRDEVEAVHERPSAAGARVNSNPRVSTGMAAKKPESSTPIRLETRIVPQQVVLQVHPPAACWWARFSRSWPMAASEQSISVPRGQR